MDAEVMSLAGLVGVLVVSVWMIRSAYHRGHRDGYWRAKGE